MLIGFREWHQYFYKLFKKGLCWFSWNLQQGERERHSSCSEM